MWLEVELPWWQLIVQYREKCIRKTARGVSAMATCHKQPGRIWLFLAQTTSPSSHDNKNLHFQPKAAFFLPHTAFRTIKRGPVWKWLCIRFYTERKFSWFLLRFKCVAYFVFNSFTCALLLLLKDKEHQLQRMIVTKNLVGIFKHFVSFPGDNTC